MEITLTNGKGRQDSQQVIEPTTEVRNHVLVARMDHRESLLLKESS
eukprot:CAMPEP_0184389412 /NCGR_PEP_ID=MMETSP0007-20130409/12463_1 /TAXON_ID=97485 /ORGANISM="Prymnesium parvum, Strain Texoma1" /LENGTH=45 /DNA_ID= /DNA_START= /DNA_END= /DNA_ORIENTATION=